MSTAFESIKQGLQEAIAHARGDERGVRVHRPRAIDVKAVRAKVGMTQEQFAARFGFSTATLRHWERGDRTPHGPALVLLNVIERNPQAVIEALACLYGSDRSARPPIARNHVSGDLRVQRASQSSSGSGGACAKLHGLHRRLAAQRSLPKWVMPVVGFTGPP